MKIVGQRACQRADQVVAPVLPELDVEDIYFQHVAGLRAPNSDGTGEDMTRHHPLALRMDLEQFGRHMKPAFVRHDVWAAADGVDGYLIAAVYREHWLELRFKEAPMTGFGAGMQMMMGHERSLEWSVDSV